MAPLEVAAAFDRISPVYDATRLPLEASVLDRIATTLSDRGVHSLLEVGVGTGRIARPLTERGLVVTGVDASARMLSEARRKSLPRLVQGSGYALPFRDASLDGALFVHVLHLLDDPRRALREASRVARRGVTAFVRPRSSGAAERGEGTAEDPRRAVSEALGRMGYPRPSGRMRGGPHAREAVVLEAMPPDELVVVSDAEVTEPLADRLRMIEKGASRQFLDVPPEALARAVAEARRAVGDREVTYRRVVALATWTRAPPADGPAPLDADPP